MRVLWVGVAGFFGAMSRYLLDGVVSRATGGTFPWGTWVVNVTGCFLVGLLTTVLTERVLPHPALRIALTVGFVGAYTTFSTFMFESNGLVDEGAGFEAIMNLLGSLLLGLLAVRAGILVGRRF